MSQEKFDQIFREKLAGYELTPQAASWDTIEDKLHKKKGPFWIYSIAASITILMVAIVLVMLRSPINDSFIGAIDHPYPLEVATLELPTISLSANQVSTDIADNQRTATTHRFTQLFKVPERKAAFIAVTTIQFANTSGMEPLNKLEINSPIETELRSNDPIKITYIASVAETKRDSVKGFKKLIAAADKFSPVNLIGDLREAKDELFADAFSKDKDNNSL